MRAHALKLSSDALLILNSKFLIINALLILNSKFSYYV